MIDFNKIYILTTGKYKEHPTLIFRDIAKPVSINHPIVANPKLAITNETVTQLFELTQFDTAENFMSSANTSTFKKALTNDWIKAYNEFGIEIDDYLTKVFDDTNDYTNGEVPTWNDVQNKFEPSTPISGGSIIKSTQLVCINPIIANTPFFVNTSSFNFTFEGDIPDLRNSVINFNTDIKLQIELNSIKQSKGSQVQRFSATQLQFNESIEIGETIFIYS